MEIVKIISEWKKRPKNPKYRIAPSKKRVMAVVRIDGLGLVTRHVDVAK